MILCKQIQIVYHIQVNYERHLIVYNVHIKQRVTFATFELNHVQHFIKIIKIKN